MKIDDLIKSLQDLSAEIRRAEDATLLLEAANVIEDLDGLLYEAERDRDEYRERLDKTNDILLNRWIPVTERLPEEKINPNTEDFEYVLCVTIWGDVRPFKYGTPIGHKNAHFWNGAGYVDAYVTHWAPLPEPPKEVE